MHKTAWALALAESTRQQQDGQDGDDRDNQQQPIMVKPRARRAATEDRCEVRWPFDSVFQHAVFMHQGVFDLIHAKRRTAMVHGQNSIAGCPYKRQAVRLEHTCGMYV